MLPLAVGGARNPEVVHRSATAPTCRPSPRIGRKPVGRLADARFSGGRARRHWRPRSTDGGRTLTAPVAINKVASVAAFTPTLIIRADGLVGVMHYDLRSNTPDPATLIADAWLLTSRERPDLGRKPCGRPIRHGAGAQCQEGLFLGDYQGLVAWGTSFRSVLALSRTGFRHRNDIVRATTRWSQRPVRFGRWPRTKLAGTCRHSSTPAA